MSWRASHLYFQYETGLLQLLKEHPVFSQGLYVVDHLIDFAWPDPSFVHGLPEGGLIVVREFGNKDDWDDECDGPWLDWHDPIFAEQAHPALLPKNAFVGVPEQEYLYIEPAPGLLGNVKSVSQACGVSAAFYYHETWAGQTETELAWIWSGSEQTAIYSDNETIAVVHEVGSVQHMKGRVIILAMAELGIEMKTPYFALHDRAFQWPAYRVQSGLQT